jgi:hypothetical protein
MRQGQQHRRGRGRGNQNNNGHRKGQNPLTRSFESNGPDVKVRGTPAHVAEKYIQLARDAQSSGDHVLAENYLQHAEHYNRIILAYREQQVQQSGEMMNGGSRHFMPRHDNPDGEDAGGEEAVGGHDDAQAGEPPSMLARHTGGDQPRGMEMQPSLDEPRRERHGDHHPRFRDRQMRHERQDGGFDRGERHGDRGFERQRERPHYHSRDTEQPAGDMREPREQREPREHREAREPRDHRPMPREMREPGQVDTPPMPAPELPQPAAARPERSERLEGAPRRRERFGLSPDQPDFLRRPVRRPRREPEPGFTPEGPPPSTDEPTRE